MQPSPAGGQWKPAQFDYEMKTPPIRPPGSRRVGSTKAEARQQKLADAAAAAAAHAQTNQQSLASQQRVWCPDQLPEADPDQAETEVSIRFDHICIAVSDVSNIVDFLSHAGGRACEGFLTPVYLSTTWEFSNTGELQVIAPVESFSHKRAGLSQAERPTTTKAFWNGNHSLAGVTTNQTAVGTAAPTMPIAQPEVKVTFLQRYLRKHGPSVHHVAFMVPNLEKARRRFQSFGYTVHGFSNKDPLWKECFLTPKQSLGVVIQVAEAGTMQPNLSWTSSTAMLSQTHLTPVVKKHIAQINRGVERWEAETTQPMPIDNETPQQKPPAPTNSSKRRSQVKSNKTAAAYSVDTVISPAHSASSSVLPPRLSLLGLRLRCASEYKARRQWGDMLQASSCTESVDSQGMKTLCFRWDQAPMYIAVDIEQPTPAWIEQAAADATNQADKKDRPDEMKEAPQWDGPKWIEMHAPASEGGAPISLEAANDEMHLDLSSSEAAGAPSSAGPLPAAITSGSGASSASSSSATPPAGSSSPRAASSSKSARTPKVAILSADQKIKPRLPLVVQAHSFSPTFRRLPLADSILRSAFVETSAPLPLPTPRSSGADALEHIQLVPITTKEIQSKL